MIEAPPKIPPNAALPYADPSTPHQLGNASGISRGDIAALGVKLVGLYIMLQGLPYLSQVLEVVGVSARFPGQWVFSELAVIAFLEAAGLALLLRGSEIGAWLLPKAGSTGIPTTAGSPVELQAAAFGVAGVLVAIPAVPEAASNIWRYLYDTSRNGPQPVAVSEFILNFIKPAAQIGVGAWLFFGSKQLARYWHRLRGEKRRPTDESGPL